MPGFFFSAKCYFQYHVRRIQIHHKNAYNAWKNNKKTPVFTGVFCVFNY